MDQLRGVRREPLHPLQLVVELRARRGIAVRQVQAHDVNAIHGRLDEATVQIFRIAGQHAADFDRRRVARQDRDTVPALLSVPDDLEAGLGDFVFRKPFLRRLQLLQTHDIRRGFLEPAEQVGEAGAHSIDVVGDDSHGMSARQSDRPARLRVGR